MREQALCIYRADSLQQILWSRTALQRARTRVAESIGAQLQPSCDEIGRVDIPTSRGSEEDALLR